MFGPEQKKTLVEATSPCFTKFIKSSTQFFDQGRNVIFPQIGCHMAILEAKGDWGICAY